MFLFNVWMYVFLLYDMCNVIVGVVDFRFVVSILIVWIVI